VPGADWIYLLRNISVDLKVNDRQGEVKMFHHYLEPDVKRTVGSTLFGNSIFRTKYEHALNRLGINQLVFAIFYDRVNICHPCRRNQLTIKQGKQGVLVYASGSMNPSQILLSVIELCEPDHADRIIRNQFTNKSCPVTGPLAP
jgi:hypothetical protein